MSVHIRVCVPLIMLAACAVVSSQDRGGHPGAISTPYYHRRTHCSRLRSETRFCNTPALKGWRTEAAESCESLRNPLGSKDNGLRTDQPDVVRDILGLGRQLNYESARTRWTFQELENKSDAIVLGQFTKSHDTQEAFLPQDDLYGLEEDVNAVKSQFLILAVLKCKNRVIKNIGYIDVIHFRFSRNLIQSNAPRFVEFNNESMNSVAVQGRPRDNSGQPETEGHAATDGQPTYLLFVAERGNGRYDPVSGQRYPEFSFRQILGDD